MEVNRQRGRETPANCQSLRWRRPGLPAEGSGAGPRTAVAGAATPRFQALIRPHVRNVSAQGCGTHPSGLLPGRYHEALLGAGQILGRGHGQCVHLWTQGVVRAGYPYPSGCLTRVGLKLRPQKAGGRDAYAQYL
jgi:hypothetical protein